MCTQDQVDYSQPLNILQEISQCSYKGFSFIINLSVCISLEFTTSISSVYRPVTGIFTG